jgi:hypothetical protein
LKSGVLQSYFFLNTLNIRSSGGKRERKSNLSYLNFIYPVLSSLPDTDHLGGQMKEEWMDTV